MKYLCLIFSIALAAPCALGGQSEIKSSFNSKNVILPSSQHTASQPYQALVWVMNTGRNYSGAQNSSNPDYNHVWGTPPDDADGNAWFDVRYQAPASWSVQTAPFSSDEYYLGKKSYRWITSDIMGDFYMRRTFSLDAVPEGNIFLACGHDDAPAEWYINGVLVHSVADGWNNDEYYLLEDSQKALLTEGENIIAVHVHQNWGGAFADCGLYAADMSRVETYLNTVSDGTWPCAYYLLNYNSDIPVAENARWYALTEDESDWISGVGPFSNDYNMFYTTEWPSQVRPILVRRHFTLDDISAIGDDSRIFFSCSYDENPVAYLNGTRLWSASGWNDNNYAVVELSSEQKKLLVEGDNVLAVSLMQGGGGGHIDYGLYLESPYDSPDGIIPVVSDNQQVSDNRVYGIFGRYVSDTLEGLGCGVYICNGKKVIVKY